MGGGSGSFADETKDIADRIAKAASIRYVSLLPGTGYRIPANRAGATAGHARWKTT